jgi:hypothetical protein
MHNGSATIQCKNLEVRKETNPNNYFDTETCTAPPCEMNDAWHMDAEPTKYVNGYQNSLLPCLPGQN